MEVQDPQTEVRLRFEVTTMNGFSKLPIEKYKIRRRNLKQPKEPAGYFMSPESGPQDTARGAIRTATADRNDGGAQCARIQCAANQRTTLPSWFVDRVPTKLTLILVLILLCSVFAARGPFGAMAGDAASLIRVLRAERPGDPGIVSLAFSADSQSLVSGGHTSFPYNRQIRLWDVRTGRLLRAFPESGTLPVASVAYSISRDGKLIASVGSIVTLWDVATGRFMRAIPPKGNVGVCCHVALSPDGGLVASDDLRGGSVRVWDTRTGALKYELGGLSYTVDTFEFSPDGKTLAVAAAPDRNPYDPVLDLWNVTTGRLARRFKPGYVALSFAYSPDGSTLAMVTGWRAYRTFVLWSVRTGQQIPSKLTVDTPEISTGPDHVAYAPSGRFLAIAWSEGPHGPEVIKIWDLHKETTVLTLRSSEGFGYIGALAFSPDGTMLAAGIGSDIMLWNVRNALLH